MQRVPVKNPAPDAERFINCLLGKKVCEKPPMIEYLIDEAVMRPITINLLGSDWIVPEPNDKKSQVAYWDNFVNFWYRMGYDFVRLELSLPFNVKHLIAKDTSAQSNGDRAWADEHVGVITSWEDFEKYEWPDVADANFFPYEYVDSHLPDGMGLMACHAAGICEYLTKIMSYEGLCLALYDSPDLVEAVSAKLGSLMKTYYERLLQLKNLIALFPGDDMGFRTATLISPDDLRKYVLPWHRQFARMAHERGIPYFLHSCGNVQAIMEDLIEDVGIDGKHSFEDAIIPAAEFHRRYSKRIATLGGVDINILSSSDSEHLRKSVRTLIDGCSQAGRFAIGSGNSIPSYIPVENYLTLLDEALR